MTLRVALVGYGHVGQEKFTSALLSIAQQSQTHKFPLLSKGECIELWILDVNPQKTTLIEHLQNYIHSKKLNLVVYAPDFSQANLLESLPNQFRTTSFDLAYIASPNQTHADYMKFFLNRAKRILVEKPLVDQLSELYTVEQTSQVHSLASIRLIDHYLFKASFLQFFSNYHQYLNKIGSLQRLSFTLLEADVIKPDRQWLYGSGMIRDLAPHGLSVLFKLHELGMDQFTPSNFELIDCQKAWYDAIPPQIHDPKETAVRLKYSIDDLPFTILTGKGVGVTQKQFIFHGKQGTLELNTLKHAITFKHKNSTEILFQAKPSTETYPEYHAILDYFIHDDPAIGLSYANAKAQIALLEPTEAFIERIHYKTGQLPFPLSFTN